MDFTLLGNRIGLLGKTNSGKSRLLMYLLKKEKRKFQKIYVISPTESVLKFYADVVPSNCIFSEYKEEWIMDLIKKLTDYKKNNDKKYNVLLILDDIGNSAHNSNALNKVFTIGRHLNISVILTMQYINMCPATARANFSYVCCSQMNKQSTDLLVEEYLMGNVSKQEFLELYHNSSKDYNFFIINCNSVKDNDDIDQIYGKIKAE